MVTRAQQKERTRVTIIEACDRLLERGVEPTIDLVADEAQVSRATVYRYFTTVFDIVWHAVSARRTLDAEGEVDAAGPIIGDRVLAAESGVNDYLYDDPDGVRRFTIGWLQRIVDETYEPGERPLRRLRYIDRALEPVADQLDDNAMFRLRHGLALAIGSESMLALVDGCQLDATEARAVTQWVCTALLDAALDEAGVSASSTPAVSAG